MSRFYIRKSSQKPHLMSCRKSPFPAYLKKVNIFLRTKTFGIDNLQASSPQFRIWVRFDPFALFVCYVRWQDYRLLPLVFWLCTSPPKEVVPPSCLSSETSGILHVAKKVQKGSMGARYWSTFGARCVWNRRERFACGLGNFGQQEIPVWRNALSSRCSTICFHRRHRLGLSRKSFCITH